MELSSDLYQQIHTFEFTVTQSEQHLLQRQKLVFKYFIMWCFIQSLLTFMNQKYVFMNFFAQLMRAGQVWSREPAEATDIL